MLPQESFDYWNIIKKRLHFLPKEPFFQEGEIWWCALGMNVGSEYNGKNDKFERPVLIVVKINLTNAWIVPLTSSNRDHPYRIPIADSGNHIVLSDIRLVSSRRLLRKSEIVISTNEYIRILDSLVSILEKAKLRHEAERRGDSE